MNTRWPMATEPTLGQRIDAMFQHYIRDDFAAPESREALIARADAAERGMVAFAEDVTGDNWTRIVAERTEALAAWRAINGEVQP